MLQRYLLALALSTACLTGQKPEGAPLNEEGFRKAVKAGLPPEPGDRAMWFALGHKEIAIPILVSEIKTKLDDSSANYFILVAADLAIRGFDQRAVDVVTDLYRTDKKRFSYLIPQVLNGASSYNREYDLAYYAVEHYPDLVNPVTNWFKESLDRGGMDRQLALQLLRREKAGLLIRIDDPLLSRLPQDARDRVQIAIERARIEVGYRENR